MEEHLISKKELLQRYGISYGALYRWKRKGLIPEEWFIRRSTVTGQETFFDEKTICERIEWILKQKDETSLDDLAASLMPTEQSARLVIVTAAGRHTYGEEDILEVLIENGADSPKSITRSIKKLLEEEGTTKG